MTPRSTRVFLFGLAVAVVTACGGDSATGTGGVSVTGTYALQTINGKGLPYALFDTVEQGIKFKIEVVSPTSLNLGSSSDFRLILTSRATFGGMTESQADTVMGTYSRAGSTLTLSSPGEEPIMATWDLADQITLSGNGDVLVFKR